MDTRYDHSKCLRQTFGSSRQQCGSTPPFQNELSEGDVGVNIVPTDGQPFEYKFDLSSCIARNGLLLSSPRFYCSFCHAF